MLKRGFFVLFLLSSLIVSLLISVKLNAQCNTPINTFPYNENFELNNGNWTRSSAAHWDWGAIVTGTKSIITSAGQGQNCWIVGGLSGANYSSGNSYLTSPCFDFSTLVNPEISLKVIWETEFNYDGVHLEYSTDQGSTWLVLGSQNSNANCVGQNWYNTNSIRFLNNTPAWSGSVLNGGGGSCGSGGGSGQWLNAKHNLTSLAGLNKVIFRFAFGAGTVCNSYEGFAIDDISIHEIPPATADFTYTCIGNNAVGFVNTPSYCQTSFSWNFGDAASGASNTSSLENPTHIFSGPGNFTVTETVNYSTGPSLIKTAVVSILGVTPVVNQSLLCNGDQNGSITATVIGGNGNYNYTWNTNPQQQTQTISNLPAGNYLVTVTETNACKDTASINLIEPTPIAIQTNITDATCNLSNGSIASTVTGGTPAYVYLWSNNEITNAINNLSAGTFSLQITDGNGCIANSSVLTVNNNIIPANVSLGNDTTICPGQTLLLSPGNFSDYLWQDNSSAPNFLVSQTGLYSVEVTNSSGCKGRGDINVLVECKDVYFPSAFTPNRDSHNEAFGPLGDVASLSEYSMFIYNRWGQVIFSSYDPYKKWDGKYKGMQAGIECFVFVAEFKKNGKKVPPVKGTITIIR
jgi:gliding motility-associated-like protein